MATQQINQQQAPVTSALQATVELSSADLLALFATPKEIIPAPGANKTIDIMKARIFYHPGATQYTVAGGGQLELLFGANQPFGTQCQTNKTILTQATESIGNFAIYNTGDYDTLSNMENLALNIKNVGAGEYTLGDGTATVVVQYSIMDKT